MIHFHKYELLSSKMGTGSAINNLTRQIRENVYMTDILYQCVKCGKFKTKTIAGHWEISKLNKLTKATN